MRDPYSVLGLDPSASLEEVTKAYRRLAKKYHPDLNPGDKTAEKKMQEINVAYERIKKGETAPDQGPGGPYQGQAQGGGQYTGPFYGFGFEEFFGGGWQQSEQSELQAARNLIMQGQYYQALVQLNEIAERDAEWYYLSAIANAGLGNRVNALNHAKEAVRREPDNAEYRDLLEQFEQGSYTYQTRGAGYGYDMRSAGTSLLRLCLAQACCWFCCRPC